MLYLHIYGNKEYENEYKRTLIRSFDNINHILVCWVFKNPVNYIKLARIISYYQFCYFEMEKYYKVYNGNFLLASDLVLFDLRDQPFELFTKKYVMIIKNMTIKVYIDNDG